MREVLKAKGDSTVAAAMPLQADISGISVGENCDIFIRIYGLTGANTAQVTVEDTVNNFAASVPRFVKSVKGPMTNQHPTDIIIKRRDIPACRFGTGSAELRLNLSEISGGTLTWEAFIEHQEAAAIVA